MLRHRRTRRLRRGLARVAGLSSLGSWLLLAGACAVDDRELDVAQAPLAPLPGGSTTAAPAEGMAGGSGVRPADDASEVTFGAPELVAAPSGSGPPPPPRLLSLGQACAASSAPCEAALRCVSGSCRLPCVTAADCATLGAAVDCTVGAALDGAGVGACDYQSYCDPAHPQNPAGGATPCAAGSGCRPSESGESACQPQPGSGTARSACSSDADCVADRFCGEQGTCLRYCLSDADCGSDVCSPFAVPRRAGNLAVGFCATPNCDPVRPQAPRDGLSACPEGQGCSAEREGQQTRCEPRGNGERYARCATNADCRPGLLCGGGDLAGACNQYCYSDADCPNERCRRFSGAGSFAGEHPLGICSAVCNPADPASSEGGFGVCPPGFGCGPSEDGLSVCLLAGTRQPYERCASLRECGAGYACDQGAYAFCRRFCLSDADCGQGSCTPVGIGAGTADVGRCSEVCNPVDPQSAMGPFTACPAGFACSPTADGQSRCYLAGSGRTAAPCASEVDCAPGFICDASTARCHEFCFSDRDCEVGSCIGLVAPGNRAADRVVNVCVP